MQKLGLSQQLQQKLSPQQIQFIKLLQVPTAELESRIEEELEINPALEEGDQDSPESEPEISNDSDDDSEKGDDSDKVDDADKVDDQPESSSDDEIDIKDYLRDDDYGSYKTQGDGNGDDDEDDREMPMPGSSSL